MKIITGSKNYGVITKAITTFDACISGEARIPINDSTNKHGKIISKLIEAESTGLTEAFDDYVVNTFHAFMVNKKKISIQFWSILKYVKDKDMLNNIFISTEMSTWIPGETEFIRRSGTDKTNLLQPRLIKMLKHTEKLRVSLNNSWEPYNIYTLSFIALLSLINGSVIETVVINVWWKQAAKSWIETLWESYEEIITAKYKAKGYNVIFECGERTHSIKISKL